MRYKKPGSSLWGEGFLVPDIVWNHAPPGIEVEAERRGYTPETEQIDRDLVKIRLTTNAGR